MSIGRQWTRTAGLVACVLCAGCEGSLDAGEWALADGTTLRELVPDNDTAVVLVADPGDCFGCSATVGEWATRRAAGEVRLYLILTREPTAAERKQLAAFRMPVAGILARSTLPRRFQSTEYLFVGGVPVMADTLPTGGSSSTVLKWARTRDRASH